MIGKTDAQGNFFDSYIQEYFLPKEQEFSRNGENVKKDKEEKRIVLLRRPKKLESRRENSKKKLILQSSIFT